jgi:hypothetical protein
MKKGMIVFNKNVSFYLTNTFFKQIFQRPIVKDIIKEIILN